VIGRSRIRKALRALGVPAVGAEKSPPTPAARALGWLRRSELATGGIRVHTAHANAYPEVTGYLIPTLLAYGERELARRCLQWLIAIQRAAGGFPDPDQGALRVFDTGQILRGLLAGLDLHPLARDAARRAADYVRDHMIEGGAGGFSAQYGGEIPESVLLYVLPPLVDAAEILGDASYRTAAERCLDFYLRDPRCRRVDTLTHFLAYELEALIDLDRAEEARAVLEELERQQARDGSVRGVGGARWVCAPGLAQLAICWHKLDRPEPADRALAWLEARQRPSGGFFGSEGPGATYFANVEPSWAVKFYLDAHRLRTVRFFERNAHVFPSDVPLDDGRAQAVLALVAPDHRVLEVGCGKGRFLKAVRARFPDAECTGVDISPSLLKELPAGIHAMRGSLESIPCPDESFDVVFSVEAIEHSPNPRAAVAELVRVAKPGGWVVVIDKQASQRGRLETPAWEWWPDASYLVELLRESCDRVTVEPVGYDGRPASDGLMVAWRGQKRSRLSGSDWNQVLISDATLDEMLARLRAGHLTEWGQVIALATTPGQRVLEIGSGTGEITLHLAQCGRRVTALDLDPASLTFTRRAAALLGVEVDTVEADATGKLPFPDGVFDCVWSSGLLEHFVFEQRVRMLREWARVTSSAMINLVPNAASVAYRVGKRAQEMGGAWPYGLEMPILTLRPEYEAAGLRVDREFSIAPKHALEFLPPGDPLKSRLAAWIAEMPPAELAECRQGYLLVTIGSKRSGAATC